MVFRLPNELVGVHGEVGPGGTPLSAKDVGVGPRGGGGTPAPPGGGGTGPAPGGPGWPPGCGGGATWLGRSRPGGR